MALKSYILRSTRERDPAGGWVRVRSQRSDRVRAYEAAAGRPPAATSSETSRPR